MSDRIKIKYWWSEDRKWFCILTDDGNNQSTVSLTVEEASLLSMNAVLEGPGIPAQGSREAVIAECAAVARAMTIKLLNELATPPDIRGLSYYDDSHLEYGHKISDLIEANIRDLALTSTEGK